MNQNQQHQRPARQAQARTVTQADVIRALATLRRHGLNPLNAPQQRTSSTPATTVNRALETLRAHGLNAGVLGQQDQVGAAAILLRQQMQRDHEQWLRAHGLSPRR